MQSDTVLAKFVSDKIIQNGMITYLDVVDDILLADGPELTEHLLKRISSCDQLIAVVSDITKLSWWVPWEIGVGSEKGFRMASYSQTNVSLPSYLSKWPTLHSKLDLDVYCKQSKLSDRSFRTDTVNITNESVLLNIQKSSAREFHDLLKTELFIRSGTK